MKIKGHDAKKIEKDFLELYGEVPPYFDKFVEDYKKGLFYLSPETIKKRYVRYSDFLKSCGYTLKERGNDKKRKIDDFIKMFIEENNSFPKEKDFEKNNVWFKTKNGYKTYKEMLVKFGYEKSLNSKFKLQTKELEKMFIEHFKDFDFVNEYIISKEYKDGKFPFGYGVVKERFKNQNFIFKKYGYYRLINSHRDRYFTKQEMTKIFKKTFSDLKNPPSQLEITEKYNANEFLFSVDNLSIKFGSYSKFLLESGYEYNKGKYSQKQVAKDGEICDSKKELQIDEFLHEKGIKHEHQPKYKDIIEGYNASTKADFILHDGTVVEYFGLKGQPLYDKKIRKKVNALEKNNIRYIDLYPKDLKRLDTIFQDYIVRGCS